MKNKKILAVIPVYNESKNIGHVLTNTLKYLKNVVVVDNASTDDTLKVVKKFKVDIIEHNQNLGKSASIKDGFNYAINNNFDAVIVLDGDGEHDPNCIPEFIENLKKNDFVIGQRNLFRSKKRNLVNKWSSLWFNFILPKINDTQCGFKALNTDLLKKMNVRSEGFEIELELLLEAVKNKAKIKTTPIKTNPLKKTHLNFLDYIMINNFFDKWVLKNYKYLSLGKIKKNLLIIGAFIGLVSGSIIKRCL